MFRTTDGVVLMFFLVRHDRQTFVIDLEPYRVAGRRLTYKFDQTFDLASYLIPLSSWEERFRKREVEVTVVFCFAIVACIAINSQIFPQQYLPKLWLIKTLGTILSTGKSQDERISYTFIEWVVVAEAKVKKLKAVVRVPETTTIFYSHK